MEARQLYRLSVESTVVDRLVALSAHLGVPRSRLAADIFTRAVADAATELPTGAEPVAAPQPDRGTRPRRKVKPNAEPELENNVAPLTSG